ncbi:AAA family ATPase [Sulfurospirillum multivorans]|uniref:ATP binding protein n=2 Tax=Sulfurospirillum multivorans TaxID=66821 RepID=A0AA86AMQ8_SULMK|nr:AAA family ATPase [Sulfurospirillum multivorans]AHJ12457.1 ATP binding protein [Sulfurospirillum multivorans DSM 12446]QEH05952.1 ATP binding protein [Sulfurospirillum multivorans]
MKSPKNIGASYEEIQGSKIIFENNDLRILQTDTNFYDMASVVITSIKNTIKFNNNEFSNNVKPIFLQDLNDVNLLLNVLQDDLKREKNRSKKSEEPSYISSIKIKNIFSIKEIMLENLDDKKEIYIVGENGDGKTLLLQSLALGLKGIDEGVVFDFIKSQKEIYSIEIEDTHKVVYNSKNGIYKNLFAYGANRNNNCQMKEDETGYLTLFHPSFDLKNPIEWLQRIDYNDKAGTKNIISVEDAKKLLKELLNSDVEIEISPSAVTFSEKGSHVNFEQLSAGYRGVITIIADLLIRLSENQPDVKHLKEFKGIVIIDEVELHLHPKWKYSFVKKLRDVFPHLQFIMTTHSPTVLLGASQEAVFYKIYKEDGEVQISNQIKNEGYTSNSLVSSPLFELETITSRDYTKSVSNDDYVYAKIHQVISEKIKNESAIDEQEILKLIEEELAKL